jgi:hypothetical protein
MVVVLGSAAALWIGTVPSIVSVSTFAFVAVFVLGAGFVTLMTWENAMATSTVAQLLYATEITEGATKRTTIGE